jgi:hypothetical protein
MMPRSIKQQQLVKDADLDQVRVEFGREQSRHGFTIL